MKYTIKILEVLKIYFTGLESKLGLVVRYVSVIPLVLRVTYSKFHQTRNKAVTKTKIDNNFYENRFLQNIIRFSLFKILEKFIYVPS